MKEFSRSFVITEENLWACDATPMYIFSEKAIENICSFSKGMEVHFVICLRDRAEQVYSWYTHHAVNRLARRLLNKDCSAGFPSLKLTDFDGIFNFFYSPISPAVQKIIQLFGRDKVTVFNHHSDYHQQSEFWPKISEKLRLEVTPSHNFYQSNKHLPEVLYFESDQQVQLSGVEYSFKRGDMLVKNGEKSTLYRDIDVEKGKQIASGFNSMTRVFGQEERRTVEDRVSSDFLTALELLNLDPKDFPKKNEVRLTSPSVTPGSLDDALIIPFDSQRSDAD
jgi:hypothetical protein